jgi:hypothetical protein
MLRVEMLPAEHGDCLWVEYGDAADPHVVVIDGGPSSRVTAGALRARMDERLGNGRRGRKAELLVVTHIDADHITGVLDLLADRSRPAPFRDVWFNGWDHLPTDVMGAKQAEALSGAITGRRLPWNAAFRQAAVVVPDDGPLPVVELAGGLRLTLLSPTRSELAALKPVWEKEVRAAGLVPGQPPAPPGPEQPDVLGDERLDPDALAQRRFTSDHSKANGASIAFLAEHDGSSVLLTGDAHAAVLARGLRRLAAERRVERVAVDAVKLPHHGSRNNLSMEVLGLLDCPSWWFSTNGKQFRHPDAVAVSRILVATDTAELVFNYRTAFNEVWDDRRLRRRYGYTTRYPPEGKVGLAVQV